ncbi:HAD hydrolase-like protein [Candidatus Bathyarchaeota archaeon]|nr:HAD hydrolase-like protein [Candidatus Bathyarchaeota archaeon]
MRNNESNSKYFRAIIFDLNGTVVEIYKISEYMKNLEAITEALGLEKERFRRAWKYSWEEYPYGDYPSVEARVKSAIHHYNEGGVIPPITADAITKASNIRMEYIAGQQRKIREGVLEAFQWALEMGYKLGMVSNCSIETALAWKENPMAAYIPDPTFSCMVKIKKPDPEIFLNELNKLHVNDPERCVYIADGDDKEFDTATALGMEVVLVKYDLEDVFRHEPFPEIDTVLDSFSNFPTLINELERRKKK